MRENEKYFSKYKYIFQRFINYSIYFTFFISLQMLDKGDGGSGVIKLQNPSSSSDDNTDDDDNGDDDDDNDNDNDDVEDDDDDILFILLLL